MSCWVVPALAAEYWGISLEELMSRVSTGVVTMRQDNGFDVIDVAPDGPRNEKSMKKATDAPGARAVPTSDSKKPRIDQPAPPAIDSDERDTFGDWRAARAWTSRTRKAPILN